MPTHQLGGSTLLTKGACALTIVIRSINRSAARVINIFSGESRFNSEYKNKKAAPFQKQLLNLIMAGLSQGKPTADL